MRATTKTIAGILLITFLFSTIQVNAFWSRSTTGEEDHETRGKAIMADICQGSFNDIKYDLSGAKQSKDIAAKDGTGPGDNTYAIQPCIETKTVCLVEGVVLKTPVCQTDSHGKNHSCGDITQGKWGGISTSGADQFKKTYPNANFSITYSNGDQARNVEIILNCDKATAASVVDLVVEKPGGTKNYHLVLNTKYACPGVKGGITGGGIFLIILVSVAFLYLVVGMLVMRFGKGATGAEMVPNHDFWVSLPGLFMDGCRFTVAKIRGQQTYNEI